VENCYGNLAEAFDVTPKNFYNIKGTYKLNPSLKRGGNIFRKRGK
jgi:hypothetical protein